MATLQEIRKQIEAAPRRKGTRLTERDRLTIIGCWCAGVSIRETAKRVNCGRRAIQELRNRLLDDPGHIGEYPVVERRGKEWFCCWCGEKAGKGRKTALKHFWSHVVQRSMIPARL